MKSGASSSRCSAVRRRRGRSRRARSRPAMPSIGVLSPASAAASARSMATLRQGLGNLGYVEGRNIAIEYRFAEGSLERLPRFATELVALKPAVIVVGSTSGIASASKITQTVPLIMVGATEDPVRLGLAESLTRPGGNVTEFTLTFDQEILGKRFQLLRDAFPGSPHRRHG